jgi:hypothetical protein
MERDPGEDIVESVHPPRILCVVDADLHVAEADSSLVVRSSERKVERVIEVELRTPPLIPK